MHFNILTFFPEMFLGTLGAGVLFSDDAPGRPKQGWQDWRKKHEGKMIVRYEINPMPFRLENDNVIYIPNEMRSHRRLGRIGPCTMGCTQFINYGGGKDGIRIIPKTAMCPNIGGAGAPCCGNFVIQNGKFVTEVVKNKKNGEKYRPRITIKICNDIGR